ncbi:serine hydrolase [Myroides sp. LJL116]
MRKQLLVLFMLFSYCIVMGQSKEDFERVMQNFKENYNQGNSEGIFKDLNVTMQNALPLEQVKQLVGGLKLQVGEISTYTLEELSPKGYADFKTNFTNTPLIVRIALDKESLISGLFFLPYTPKVENATTVNALKDMPEDIANLLFDKTKNMAEGTQVSLALVKGENIVYYGLVKKGDSIVSLDNRNSVFEIGSITKVFTSTVFSSLIQQGKIDKNANANDYFAFTFLRDTPISLLSLTNHTSGLPRLSSNMDLSSIENPYQKYTREDLDTYLKESLVFESEPLTVSSYSNLGVALLGYSLEKSQNKAFLALLKENVLDKYGLEHTYVSPSKVDPTSLVMGQDKDGNKVINWDFDVYFPAGGLLSTSVDLSHFLQCQFNEKDSVMRLTHQPTFTSLGGSFGMGWFLMDGPNKQKWIWHGGATNGYTSAMIVDTKSKVGVVVLSNVSAFSPFSQNINTLGIDLMEYVY